MNKDISVTQASNIGAIIGIAMLFLDHFHVNITQEEVQAFIGAAIALGSIIVSLINRYKKGDITRLGVKKTY